MNDIEEPLYNDTQNEFNHNPIIEDDIIEKTEETVNSEF